MEKLAFCPACISADLERRKDCGSAAAAGRSAWVLKPIMTCVQHGLELLVVNENRPATDWEARKLNDFSRRIQRVLDCIDKQILRAEARPPSSLELHLSACLSGSVPSVNELIDALPFYAIAQASLYLGAFNTVGPLFALINLSDNERRIAGATGFNVLTAGLGAVKANLEQQMDRWPKGKNAATAAAFFGTMHTWLTTRSGDSSLEFLRDAIRETMISTRALRRVDKIYGVPVGDRRLQSVHTAAQETGLHPKRLQRVLVKAGVLAQEYAQRRAHLAVFASTAETTGILESIKRCIPKNAAVAYINSTRTQFDVLQRAGLIEPFTKADGVLKNYGFDTKDLDDFIASLFAITRDYPSANLPLVPVREAVKRCCASVDKIVRLILDKRLTRVSRLPGISGFQSILVDPIEVVTALERPVRPGLSIAEINHRTGWDRRAITALIRHGHLPSQQIVNPSSRLPQSVVEPSDLQEFVAKFISLYSVARMSRRSISDIKMQLLEYGISPAFDPKTSWGIFYKRKDLAAASNLARSDFGDHEMVGE